jgi:hypothetical protein
MLVTELSDSFVKTFLNASLLISCNQIGAAAVPKLFGISNVV